MPRERAEGFTLMELLVALTILGLLVTLLSGGLRFGARVWETGQAASGGLSTMQATQALLRRVIESGPAAVERPKGVMVGNGFFRGSGSAVRFIGMAPALAMPEGLYEITLARRGDALVLSWNAFRSDLGTLADKAGQRVVADGLRGVSFSYRARDPGAGWQDTWSNTAAAPALVRIRLTFTDGARRWPDLIAAPRLEPAGLQVVPAPGARRMD